ncbi:MULTISPECIES: PP2C family protein-serine/threonine phosphatase [unclassified Streptomyces]|uniref:PP2C family protein-serine/threonine phosphatase n=1 Tax=unclassified Streptomyces TaxID=2593676 RepID=UPI00037F0F64|nr:MULTISPECIES: PP2C family protein-serine/threonine phosphatase [unclassified Streptomyces]MYT27349.1 SpoIIE family protein phosphatase [Streptomyces sp. SID8354]
MPFRRLTRLLQRPDPSHALLLIPVGLIVAVYVIDVLTPPDIHLGPLLVAAPALTAALAGPGPTALIGVLAVAAQVSIGIARNALFTENLAAQIGALIVVAGLVFVYTVVRERNERRLSRSRSIAAVAQQVLLRPLPTHTADLEIASLYLPAEEEAEMGGDLYAAARTTASTRLIIGDVRGKGLPAYSHAALILGAFRAVAHRQATLPRLTRHLDGALRWDTTQWHTTTHTRTDADTDNGAGGEGRPHADADGGVGADAGADGDSGENFATATVLDIPDRRNELTTINCGHPPALLLRNGQAHPLTPLHTALPLGLGNLATPPQYPTQTFPFHPGDLLLLYTDGVTEARNPHGTFYPLAQRASAWTHHTPHHTLQQLRNDLLAHTHGRLTDDAAAIAIRRLPPHDAARHHPDAADDTSQESVDDTAQASADGTS